MLHQHKTQILLVAAALVIGLIFAGMVGPSVVSAQGPGGATPYPGQEMPGWGGGHMMGGHGMMQGYWSGSDVPNSGQGMPGWGGGHMMGGHGMMQGQWSGSSTPYSGQGMMGWGNGNTGMMGGWGMMAGWTPPANLIPAGQPLTLDSAVAVANAYLDSLRYGSTLELGEVMQFAQNFYAQAVESSTGHGAFEFLINPTNGIVWPEPGPNMMWNLRYGMMNEHMGFSLNSAADGQTMPVSAEQAHQYAQAFLDEAQPGTLVSEDATAFFGYYTMDFSRDGAVVGMLSVNGYTGQVWLHTWHGDFVQEVSPNNQ